jgi:hypothetical protein
VDHDQSEEQGTSQGFTVFSNRAEREESFPSGLSRDNFTWLNSYEKRINMGGEFYMVDFGYFSMSVYS